jgi:hypothetical protein
MELLERRKSSAIPSRVWWYLREMKDVKLGRRAGTGVKDKVLLFYLIDCSNRASHSHVKPCPARQDS